MISSQKKVVLRIEHFIRRNERVFKGAGIALVLFTLFGFGFLSTADAQNGVFVKSNASNLGGEESSMQTSLEEPQTGSEVASNSEALCVYICGCVNQPGVYYLPLGSRVCDAVEKALGLSEDAALESINLARELHDGEQIVIASVNSANQSADSGGEEGAQNSSTDNQKGNSSLININTANSTQLQQIPGIGAAYAQRIIDYRNAHGSFSSVDELTNVSGIGSKRIESIRAYICV